MNVWQELGIAPTVEAREIRRAYAQRLRHRHPEDDPDGFQRLRAAYESALAAAALPPLPGETPRAVSVSEGVLAVEAQRRAVDVVADASPAADQHGRLVAEAGERHRGETVWPEDTGEPCCSLDENNESQPGTVTPEEGPQQEVHAELEEVNELSQRLLEALQAGNEPDAVAWLTRLIAHPRLVQLEYRWQYEGWLLSSLMQLPVNPPVGFTKVARRFFGWATPHRALAPAHHAYLDALLIDLDLCDQVEALRGEGQRWLYQLHRSRRPLAAWLLTGAYHPRWWTYALLHRGVYAAMREVWTEVKDYGRDHLQAVLEPGTVAWWERWVGAPAEPGLLRGVQTLHRLGLVIAYFVLGITTICGITVWRTWMQGKALDPTLLQLIGINLGIMLACYVTLSLVGMALILVPAKGLRKK
jgi:hypothetical protein